jgi:hypothetical protein
MIVAPVQRASVSIAAGPVVPARGATSNGDENAQGEFRVERADAGRFTYSLIDHRGVEVWRWPAMAPAKEATLPPRNRPDDRGQVLDILA